MLVKGIVTAEDATLAVEHGAAGVIVSNHGGRQLDGAPATIDALPEVVEAVDGRIEVLVDGGIRRGADVVKALALGARAVLAGRAPLWGLAARGEQGAREVLELLREEIELAMVLTGCRVARRRRPRSHVTRRAPLALTSTISDPNREQGDAMPAERFVQALNEQVANEFAASHQYVAIGAHYEAQTLPQLARFFYAQAVEERGHAMMMIKYLLDTNAPVRLQEVAAPTTGFADHIAPIKMALEQERKVSAQIGELFAVAREEGDYLSEQFVQWFLKEQVEEEATMTEILDVAERVRDFPMTLEEYIAREKPGRRPRRPAGAAGRRRRGSRRYRRHTFGRMARSQVRPLVREAVEPMRIKVPTRGNRCLEALSRSGQRRRAAEGLVARRADERRTGSACPTTPGSTSRSSPTSRCGCSGCCTAAASSRTSCAIHGMRPQDAEVVIAAGCLLHDVGMSIHRTDHEAYSLFLAADKLGDLLAGAYDEPERSVIAAEALHAIIAHRRRGDPLTIEAGIVRVADALDMAQGRSRLPVRVRAGRTSTRSRRPRSRRSRSSRARRRPCGSRST